MLVRVLNRYVGGGFLKTFLVTAAVLTFVMYVGTVMKAIDYMTKGISGLLIMKMFALNIPFTMTFVLPMSVLTAVLLHFGRLSADGEITAMKASGVSLWQVAAPILLLSVGLTAVCLYVNAEISPKSHFARRQLQRALGDEDPMALLDEGSFVDFPGVKIYVGKKDGDRVEDLVMIADQKEGRTVEVRATGGTVRYDAESRILNIDLENAEAEEREKNAAGVPERSRKVSAENYPLQLDLNQIVHTGDPVKKKPRDMGFTELLMAIRNVRSTYPDILEKNVPSMRMKLAVEATKRLVLAVSCFSFTLLCIPLGVQTSRRESSAGIGLALLVFFLFYLFIILADSLVGKPQYRPDLILWIPVIASQAGGLWLMHLKR